MLKHLLNLVAPVSCLICGKPKELCCQIHLEHAAVQPTSLSGLPGRYALELDEQTLKVIAGFKDKSLTALAPQLGALLSEVLHTEIFHGAEAVLIPPTTPKAYRRRGYVPVRLLLRHAALRIPVLSLQLTKAISDQRLLSAEQRAANLIGAYQAPKLSGKKVLLFDDVITTGSTIKEMHRAAISGGAQVLGFCALARRF
jgi:predicted amidophosphoribosyltransferase